MKKTAKLYLLFGIGIALITFNTSSIASEDDKMYIGAACQSPSNTDAILRTSAGNMYNNSSVSQSWVCPIVRDIYAGWPIEYARVRVVDLNPNTNITCVFNSLTSTGASYSSYSASTSGTPGTVDLIMGSGDGNVVSSVAGGYYYIRCVIPGTYNALRSGVIGYTVTENDGEN